MRGRLVSRPVGDVLREAEQLVRAGVKEILVISQDTSAYGADLKYAAQTWRDVERRAHFYDLAAALGELGVWIRLHYVYPYPHVDQVIDLMAAGKVLPYLDIPFQHASARILKLMKRPAAAENTLQRIAAWRGVVPDITIRSTFIVGFPGETRRGLRGASRVAARKPSSTASAASSIRRSKAPPRIRLKLSAGAGGDQAGAARALHGACRRDQRRAARGQGGPQDAGAGRPNRRRRGAGALRAAMRPRSTASCGFAAPQGSRSAIGPTCASPRPAPTISRGSLRPSCVSFARDLDFRGTAEYGTWKSAADRVVTIHYTLKDDGGAVLDSSAGGEPLAYIQGHGNLVAGLERALEGKRKALHWPSWWRPPTDTARGTSRWFSAFRSAPCRGPAPSRRACSFRRGPRTACACSPWPPSIGDMVTLDGNHPLADQTLHFDVQVVGVREATSRGTRTRPRPRRRRPSPLELRPRCSVGVHRRAGASAWTSAALAFCRYLNNDRPCVCVNACMAALKVVFCESSVVIALA